MADGSGVTRVKVETVSMGGGVWFAGWLFTLGFVKLSLGQAVAAVIVWPYFLGLALR